MKDVEISQIIRHEKQKLTAERIEIEDPLNHNFSQEGTLGLGLVLGVRVRVRGSKIVASSDFSIVSVSQSVASISCISQSEASISSVSQ